MGSKLPKTPELRLNRWHRLGLDLRALPLRQAVKLVLHKASKRWRARRAEGASRRQIAAIQADLASALRTNHGLSAFLDSKFTELDGFPILPGQKRDVGTLLNQQFPTWVARCIESADRICGNRISVLGHEIRLQEPPDWHKDHLNGGTWPTEPCAGLRRVRMIQGSDIKFVWELSRFHHGVTLGRAFALTADERFAEKFISLFSAWRAANPPGIGPNWTCAMEVAIRALNLLWAAALLASSKAFNQAAREAFTETVLAHGVFIFHHLEYDEQVVGQSLQPVNGNHYLSDLAGLLHISLAFPEYVHASTWREFATKELFREIRAQVDDDGVHKEYSPGYHRLVLEMVLGCLLLLERHGTPIPPDIRTKVLGLLDFVRHYRTPSGGVPLVRDIDSGRFCILGDEELTSHDHLLALGAIVFDKPDLYPGELFEDCLWYLGPTAYDWHLRHSALSPSAARAEQAGQKSVSGPALRSPQSALYRQSGFAVMRHESHYLLALCCPKGLDGYCGHTHNDFLSFDLEAYGRSFLTDSGSYVYTQSPEWRNRFRSTVSHNTLQVDGQEQNRFSSSQLFEIDSRVRPEVRQWISNDEQDILDAAYTLTLPDGTNVTHERRFVFLKDQGLWMIRDSIIGAGQHKIETRFHFSEGLELAPAGERGFSTLQASGPNLFLAALGNLPLTATIESGWVSRVYAIKKPIRVLRFQMTVRLPYEQWFVLAPTRSAAGTESPDTRKFDEMIRKMVAGDSGASGSSANQSSAVPEIHHATTTP